MDERDLLTEVDPIPRLIARFGLAGDVPRRGRCSS